MNRFLSKLVKTFLWTQVIWVVIGSCQLIIGDRAIRLGVVFGLVGAVTAASDAPREQKKQRLFPISTSQQ